MVHLIYNTHDESNSSKQQVATTKVEKKATTATSQQSNNANTSTITPPSMTSAAVLQRQRSARREKRRRELEQRRAKQQQQQQRGKVNDEYTPSPKTLGLELVASPVMLAKNTIDDSIDSGGDNDEPSNLIVIPLTDDNKDSEVQEEEEFIIVNKRKGGGSSNGYISRDGTLTSNVELELISATPEKECMLIENGEQVINLQSIEVEESSSTFDDDEYPIDEIERNNSIRRDNTLASKESQLLSMMDHYEGESSPDLVLDDETCNYSDDGDDISTVINYSSLEYDNTSAWYMNVLDSLCECVGQYLPEEDVSDLISCSDDSEWS